MMPPDFFAPLLGNPGFARMRLLPKGLRQPIGWGANPAEAGGSHCLLSGERERGNRGAMARVSVTISPDSGFPFPAGGG
jgi:hypothetical protein